MFSSLNEGSFLLAVAAILLTPGPTNTLLAASGSRIGLRRSLMLLPFEGFGYLLATSMWGGLLHNLADDHPLALRAIKLICGLYIAALGWRLWRTAAHPAVTERASAVGGRALFIATLLNPKAAVFGMALLPPTTWDSLCNWGVVMTAFLTLVISIGSLWIGLGATLMGGRVRWLQPQTFQRLAGTVLAGFAVWLVANALLL
ncbi:LysE family translocator [Ottowia flava]|uniref:LysE family translocator n=1 Tax=Ottowia flava TaxID=2675430 RepID=A0ABW4KV69_9BURK|nr:LysE family transporter [Ottowia sp. GY511]